MILKHLNIRPICKQDVEPLDQLRRRYLEAWLELPHGFDGIPGVETAVAEKHGKIIGSLTGTMAAVFDPFIHDPEASGPEIFSAVLALERVLAYNAQVGGAVDAYIAIPKSATKYIEMVERCGYTQTLQDCVVLRRPLVPDTVTLLENESNTTTPQENV